MPRYSKKEPEPAACGKYGCSGYFHTGLAILFLFFTDRHRIKINYGIILAQHLVSCQLNNTISSIFNSYFLPYKIYFTFFHIFSSICSPVRYFFFRLTCYNSSSVSGIRSLITEERTPSCIWVPMNGSLLTVLPSVRIKLHTVQPVNAAGKGTGNGEGRYVYTFY